MAELPLNAMPVHDEDDGDPDVVGSAEDGILRLIICMSKASSERLAQARYLQSDIAFKRVAGFLEFEIGGLDEDSNLGT